MARVEGWTTMNDFARGLGLTGSRVCLLIASDEMAGSAGGQETRADPALRMAVISEAEASASATIAYIIIASTVSGATARPSVRG